MAASMSEGLESASLDKPVLEPLLLPDMSSDRSDTTNSPRDTLPCILCDTTLDVKVNNDLYLQHLLVQHKLVIADVNLVANFRSYVLYWRERLKEQPLTDFCSKIQTTQTKSEQEGYFLLSDVLPEDKQLRDFLQKRKLEHVLTTQQREREDVTFSRGCLFCKEHFQGNRSELFNHMAQDHSFNVGQPDNLVYVNEFLDILEQKLSSLQCLYCEKTFRDKIVLKEHMRKKQHRKINCKNNIYDKFYIINYLELGKNWENIQHERDNTEPDIDDTDTEDEWSDWEEAASGQAICLYCEYSSSNTDKLRGHMHELHDLDLTEVKLRLNLTFYQQIKLVNYIRRQVHLGMCIGCEAKFDSRSSLTEHMFQSNHTNAIPDTSVWDQPQYFFPTYENDNLLCQLDDCDDLDLGHHDNETVIAEDTPTLDTILTQEHLRRDILSS